MLVEKPVTVTADEGGALARAAKAAGVVVLVGHHRRHNPRIAVAYQALRAGRLGRVVSVGERAAWPLQLAQKWSSMAIEQPRLNLVQLIYWKHLALTST